MNKLMLLVFSVLALNAVSQTATETLSGTILQDRLLDNDTIYILNERVYVESGYTLTIEAGTIIKGTDGIGTAGSCLVIQSGATIEAMGTPAQPIIFTSIRDSITCDRPNYPGFANLTADSIGLWGGVVILGNAPISSQSGITDVIEGFPIGQGSYGGNDASDNSGTFQYVQIRHAGTLTGNGNELNGLTLAGVGNQTTVNHVEIVASLDDGIEFFGGTVEATDVLLYNMYDDAIDTDQGWGGSLDNFIVITQLGTSRALEIDGPEGTLQASQSLTNGTLRGAPGVELGMFRGDLIGSFSNLYFFDFPAPSNTGGTFSLGIGATTTFGNGSLTFADLEIDTAGMNSPLLTSVFEGGTDVHATIVLTPTVGANICEFTSWALADRQGVLTASYAINPIGCNNPAASNYCPYAQSNTNCRYDVVTGPCATASISGIEGDLEIVIYPNPTSEQFTIQLPQGIETGGSYVVYDVFGRNITQDIISDSTQQIDASNWAKGVYVVQLGSGDQSFSKKIVKK